VNFGVAPTVDTLAPWVKCFYFQPYALFQRVSWWAVCCWGAAFTPANYKTMRTSTKGNCSADCFSSARLCPDRTTNTCDTVK